MNTKTSTILKAGLLVGTLDILSAVIYVTIRSGSFVPFNICKFVASGIFGKNAATGGTLMIIAGLVLHYIIAFAFTIFFFWLYPKIKFLSKNKILTGVIYGILIWTFMNVIVVPLSNVAYRPFNVTNAAINMIILIVCIGIPLSFIAAKSYKIQNSSY